MSWMKRNQRQTPKHGIEEDKQFLPLEDDSNVEEDTAFPVRTGRRKQDSQTSLYDDDLQGLESPKVKKRDKKLRGKPQRPESFGEDITPQDDLLMAGAPVSKKNKKRKKWNWKKRVLVIALSVVFVLCSVAAGVFLYLRHIWVDPFSQLVADNTPLPSGSSYDDLLRQADQDLLNKKGIVNVLLIGCDYAEERETWSGKHAYHADVMIVLAINTNTHRVDMISLPRDTYAKIPGVQGIYKLNSSLDCGGGLEAGAAGFEKVVEADEWMLGGVPISYYYAVTMPVVKDLVNAIGGVDYDIDVEFTMDGRHYNTGMQHMDGQAVLDYIRVRKNLDADEAGDLNRINRQKKILVAVFKKMQQQNLWTSLPTILNAVKGVQTNASINVTAALAVIAYNLDENNISMWSMGGTMGTLFWDWRYCFTDQTNRMKILQQVYGSDFTFYPESQYTPYTFESARAEWAKMMDPVYEPNAVTLINYVQTLINNGTVATPTPTITLTPTPTSPTPTPTSNTPTPTVSHSPSPSSSPTSSGTTSTGSSKKLAPAASAGTVSFEVYEKFLDFKAQLAYVKYLQGKGSMPSPMPSPGYSSSMSANARLVAALADLKTKGMALAALVNSPLSSSSKWAVPCYPSVNEIDVDFR